MATKNKKINKKPETKSSTLIEGNVSLKLVNNKGKIIKKLKINNSATSNLLLGIAYYLSRQPDNHYVPFYAGVGHTSQSPTWNMTNTFLPGEYKGKRTVITNLAASAELENNEVTCIASYQAIFSYNYLTDVPINELGLFNTDDNQDTLLARTRLRSDITLSPGVSLILEWNIYIKNASENSN